MDFSRKAIILLLLFFVFFGGFVSAREGLEVEYPEIEGFRPVYEERETALTEYLLYITQFLIALAIVVTVFSLVRAGVLWMTSRGDPLKVRESKEQLSSALMGLLIVLFSFAFLSAIDPELVELRELEVIETEEDHPAGVYLSLEGDFPEEVEEEGEAEGVYRISSSVRHLEELSGRIEAIRIANQTGQKGELIGYYYGVILHEEPAFRGRCEFFVNEGTEPEDFTATGDFASVTVVRIDESPPEEGGVTAYEKPDFREDHPYQRLGRFTENFRPLDIDEVWSLDIEGSYGVVLSSGSSWEEMGDGCGVLLDGKPVSDLKGYHMNRCNPRRATPFFAAYESCATHYAVFPLF